MAKGQNIDYSQNKEENGPRASSGPALGLNTIIFKHVYWYMQQISGERLQDHWSSCLLCQSADVTSDDVEAADNVSTITGQTNLDIECADDDQNGTKGLCLKFQI